MQISASGLRLLITSLLVASASASAQGHPNLEWRTFYFWLNGPTFEFQERLDQELIEDCSAENEGRGCFISTTIYDEPCVAGTGSVELLKSLEKLAPSPTGRGQFLVETLSAPWSKMYPEFFWEVTPGKVMPIDEYALIRGVRVYGPKCKEAEAFYWLHDFRILELNRYDPKTGVKLPN